MPKKNAFFAQSATEQLKSIDDLRDFMTLLVDSSEFHELESKEIIDFKEIMRTSYIGETGDDFRAFLEGRGGLQDTGGEVGNTQDLKQAVNHILAKNVSDMNP